MLPKLLKTFLNEAISSLITIIALIFVIDFFNHNHKFIFLPQQNQNVTSFLLDSQHSQLRVNQNKQNGQTYGEKVKLTIYVMYVMAEASQGL